MDDVKRLKEFGVILLRCFEDTTSGLLGEGAKKALLERLEKDTGLKRDELIVQTEMLKSGMEKIFGRSALVLERMIAKQIYGKLGLDTPPLDFEAAIKQAEQAYVKGIPTILVSR